MKAMSMKQAWEMANEIFPTDYEKDEQASQNAGYPIYRSTADGHWYDYICDLNARLEVNLSDGRTINIWIDESYFEEQVQAAENDKATREAVEESKASKEFGAIASLLYEAETYKKMVFCVDGSKWNNNPTEQLVYRGLGKELAGCNAGDLVAAYCEAHGIRWGTICDVKVNHYQHGTNGERGGHYIVEAYVSERA